MVTRCCLSIRTWDMTNPGALMARAHEVHHNRSVLYVTRLRQQCVRRDGLFSIPLLVLTRQIRSVRHTPTTDNSRPRRLPIECAFQQIQRGVQHHSLASITPRLNWASGMIWNQLVTSLTRQDHCRQRNRHSTQGFQTPRNCTHGPALVQKPTGKESLIVLE